MRMTKRRLIRFSARKTMGSASEDRISEMPDNIIEMILDSLPIHDAVRTSVLARKWQYRWVTNSKLSFDYEFFRSLSDKYKSDLQVQNIINKILLLHTGHIYRFALVTPRALPLKNDINHWLHFVSKNGIKEFILSFSGFPRHQLGLQLYSCLELTHLEISSCILNPTATFEGFPNLTTLKLIGVSMNEKFGDAISACPWLEWVRISSSDGIQNLVLRAPKLKYFYVEANGLKTIWLNSPTILASFSLNLGYLILSERLEKLCLGDSILEFSGASSVPKRLPTSMNNLKMIFLQRIDFNDVAHMACTLCMIRSSPKLSELEIWGLHSESAIEPDHDFVDDYGDQDCSFGQLLTVKLCYVRDLKAEMAFVKFLLARSPLLERMSIKAARGTDKDKSLSMCEKLMKFGRASPKASLIYSVFS